MAFTIKQLLDQGHIFEIDAINGNTVIDVLMDMSPKVVKFDLENGDEIIESFNSVVNKNFITSQGNELKVIKIVKVTFNGICSFIKSPEGECPICSMKSNGMGYVKGLICPHCFN